MRIVAFGVRLLGVLLFTYLGQWGAKVLKLLLFVMPKDCEWFEGGSPM